MTSVGRLSCLLKRAILTGAAITLIAAASTTDTPQDRFDEDAFCLGVSAAAGALPESYAKQKSEAETMRKVYAKRLPGSAKALGKPMPQAFSEADKYRKSALMDLNNRDPKTAAREQADLARNVQLCAALPVFEIIGHRKR